MTEALQALGLLLTVVAVWLLIWRRGPWIGLQVAVAGLPFTQVPTLKLLARWRLSEITLGLLLLYGITKGRPEALRRWETFTPLQRRALVALAVFTAYTVAVAIGRAVAWDELAESVITRTYFHHPLLRAALEGTRSIGIVVLVAGVVGMTTSLDRLRRLLDVFVIAGVAALAVGWYQMFAFNYGLAGVPGAYLQANGRVGGTLYEPTAYGTFAVVLAITAAAAAMAAPRDARMPWYLAVAAGGASAALAGSVAALVVLTGATVVAVASMRRIAIGRHAVVWAILTTSFLLGGAGAVGLFGSDYVTASLSGYFISRDVGERIDVLPTWPEQASGLDARTDEEFVPLPVSSTDRVIGLGAGISLLAVGGTFGLERLLLESGGVGAAALLGFEVCIVFAAFGIWRRSTGRQWRATAPYLVAAWAAAGAVTLNYINITDAWLWFPSSLVMAAAVLFAMPEPYCSPAVRHGERDGVVHG